MRPTHLVLALALTAALPGCGGTQASRARAAYVAAHGQLPQPDEIRVEEYLADYDESLPDPTPNALGMTLEGARAAWGAEASEPLFVAQVAVRGRDSHVRPPLGLMLVVDRSGSMQDEDKMVYVREGLHRLVGELHPADLVGVTAFDDRAEVILPMTSVGEGERIHWAIDQLVPRGGTNLSEGLRAGYEGLDRMEGTGVMRRVLLLTDAMANVGDTDMHRIAHQARAGDARGISLSAVGVGLAYEDAVLAEMARQGQGNHYFLDSPQRITRVFEREVQGLLEDVADQAHLTFSPAAGVEVVRVEGLDVETSGEHWRMDLGRIGAGQHRVALITLRGVDPRASAPIVGRFTLDYLDMRSGEAARQTSAEPLRVVTDASDGTVARNSAVAWMARDLREVAALAQAGRWDEADARLTRARAVISAVAAARPSDAQLAEDLVTLDGFARAIATRSGRPYRAVRAHLRVSVEAG